MGVVRSRAALIVALPLCACAATLVTADAPKTVRDHPITPYAWHEECMHLEPGDRVEFTFESTEPVDFNVHYHEGKVVVMPLVREKTRSDAGVFAPPAAQDYCLMWEAGRAGAILDYQVRVKPAGN
jgi:hypothetical protein